MAKLYEALGLVNTREMFKKAMEGKYAIPAYNFNNMEQLQAIITGCVREQLAGHPAGLERRAQIRQPDHASLHGPRARSRCAARNWAATSPSPAPRPRRHLRAVQVLHRHRFLLRHDRRLAPSLRRKHRADQTGRGVRPPIRRHRRRRARRAGRHRGRGQAPKSTSTPTRPTWRISSRRPAWIRWPSPSAHPRRLQVQAQCQAGRIWSRRLRFDILEKSKSASPAFPIVLHGASSVLPDYVDMINKIRRQDGGRRRRIPEEQLRHAAKSAVCKINIDSDGRLVMTAMIRKVFAEKPAEFDPRKYLGPAREELKKLIIAKNTNVLGSAGKA